MRESGVRWVWCAAALAIAGSGAAAEPKAIGLWGDGSGVHPDSNPPVRWDYDTGYNILWHTPAPSFSYSAPTVLGDRVVVLNDMDPEHPFPLLVGLDLATGKECWRVEVNPLPEAVADPVKRKDLDDLLRAVLRYRHEIGRLREAWNATTNKSDLAERMTGLGLKPTGNPSDKGYPGKADVIEPAPPGLLMAEAWKTLGGVGIGMDNWRASGGGWFFGETFATPIADGERVYVQLAWGTWAAYDRDGRRIWMRHSPSKGHGDYCQCGRSPLLWRNLLVADLGDWVRAFDRATGEQKWAFDRRTAKIGQHEMASPVVLSVGGADYAYCNGSPPFAVRLEDGTPFKIEGIPYPGLVARAGTDQPDILFLAGGGEHGGWEKNHPTVMPPAAFRVRFADGALKADLLWSGVNGKSYGSQYTWNIHHQGRWYFRDIVLDGLTGRVLLGSPGARNGPGQAVPGSTYTLAIAGRGDEARIYGQGYAEHGSEKREDDLGAVVLCEVHDLKGRRLAANRLRGLPGQQAMRQRNGLPNWYSYANNFTPSGNRILSRSCNEVICIADLTRAYSDREWSAVAPALASQPGLAPALAALQAPDRPVRVAAVQALARLGDAAVPAAPRLLEQMRAADDGLAEAGFLGICALGSRATAVASNLFDLALGPPSLTASRAQRALAAMGAGAETEIVKRLGDETGYATAMRIAALMDDYDAATRVFARGLVGGKAPRFLPWLPPYERGQELTLRDIVPEAMMVRGWKSRAGAAILAEALPRDVGRGAGTFLSFARIIGPADPSALVPRLGDLRRLLRTSTEGRTWALDAIAAMGPLAAEALPDLRAWRSDPALDARLAPRLDAAIAAVNAPVATAAVSR